MQNISSDKVKIAVFDFDGTSIDVQSGPLFSWYLYRKHFIGFFTALSLLWWGIRYKLHLPISQNKPREVIFASMAHLSHEEILSVMKDFHDSMISSKYREQACIEIQKLKAQGYIVLLVSATFEGIALAAAERLDVDDFIATTMVKDLAGTYYVSGFAMEGLEKPRAVSKWADEHFGSNSWILARAYGDHHSDIELLKLAQEAYAVSPDHLLKRVALKRHWHILNWDR